MKAFFLILVLAGGLRLATVTFDSLWLDESYQTVVESYGNDLPDLFNGKRQPFLYKLDKPASCANVLRNFRKVDPLCPPLYAVLINHWLTVFGGSDFVLRGFSVFCSLLSIAAIYFFGSLLLGKRCALYAALLQAISPFDIGYAQEARMYALTILCATLFGGSLLCLCLKKQNKLLFSVIYIIAGWALINTHYTNLFIWAFAILAGLIISLWHKDWRLLAQVLMTNLAIFILSIPGLSFFFQAAELRAASFYVTRQANVLWPIWALFARLPFNWLTFLVGKKVMFWAFPAYFTGGFLLAYAAFILIKKYGRQSSEVSEPTLLMLFAWGIVPAIMILVLDIAELHRVIEIPRYLMGSAPAIYLIAGYALYLLEPTPFFLLLTITHASFCLANNAYMHIVPQRENWRAVAQIVERVCQSQELLFVSPYYNIVCLDRYLRCPLRQIGVSSANAYIENFMAGMETKSLPCTFWILSGQNGDTIFNTVPGRYKIMQKYDFPHAIHLRQYGMRAL